jgi:hypothetical protein
MKNAARMAGFGLLLVVACCLTAGCYTVLKRPASIISEESQALQEGDESERWIDPDYIWYDPFYHWYYPTSYEHWRYYYTYPWWWNDYWFWSPSTGSSPAPTSTDKHIWDDRRGPEWMSPPASPATPTTASQPKSDSANDTQSRPSESSRKDAVRRQPDWNADQSGRSNTDLEQRQRQQDDRGESDGEP